MCLPFVFAFTASFSILSQLDAIATMCVSSYVERFCQHRQNLGSQEGCGVSNQLSSPHNTDHHIITLLLFVSGD